MYKLFCSPGSCSMAVHIALLECGQKVELERVDLSVPAQQRSPEFQKVNPRGQVPVLVDGDQVLREGAAIMIHVLEKHKSPLLPSSGKERDAAIEALMFCNATLHPAYGRAFFLRRAPDSAEKEKMLDAVAEGINKLWADIEQTLSRQPYLAGSQPTMADILMTVIANWSGNVPRPINIGPNTKKLFKAIIERPAYKEALTTEKVEYKMAA